MSLSIEVKHVIFTSPAIPDPPGHQGADHGSQRHPERRQGDPRGSGGNVAGARGGAPRRRIVVLRQSGRKSGQNLGKIWEGP